MGHGEDRLHPREQPRISRARPVQVTWTGRAVNSGSKLVLPIAFSTGPQSVRQKGGELFLDRHAAKALWDELNSFLAE